MKKIIWWGHLLFKIVILVLLPVVFVTLLTANTDYLRGIRSYVVQTGSMEPVIPVGSLIYVQPQASYQVGEIITFQRGQISVTHRIVELQTQPIGVAYQTKGDANQSADPDLVYATQVKGRLALTVPYVGLLINFVKTVPGFIVLVVIPTLIFVFVEILTIKREWEKQLEKKFVEKFKQLEE